MFAFNFGKTFFNIGHFIDENIPNKLYPTFNVRFAEIFDNFI